MEAAARSDAAQLLQPAAKSVSKQGKIFSVILPSTTPIFFSVSITAKAKHTLAAALEALLLLVARVTLEGAGPAGACPSS